MIKDIFLDLSQCKALGDTICATPTLRKLFNSYNQKVVISTHFPEIFKNNPYVKKIY